jgi:hypothetical protein
MLVAKVHTQSGQVAEGAAVDEATLLKKDTGTAVKGARADQAALLTMETNKVGKG